MLQVIWLSFNVCFASLFALRSGGSVNIVGQKRLFKTVLKNTWPFSLSAFVMLFLHFRGHASLPFENIGCPHGLPHGLALTDPTESPRSPHGVGFVPLHLACKTELN